MTSNYRRVALGVIVVCFIAAINLSQEKLTLGSVVPSAEEVAANVHYTGQQGVVKSKSADGPDESASEDQTNEVNDNATEEPTGKGEDAGQESAGEDDADAGDNENASEDAGDDNNVGDQTNAGDDDNASEDAEDDDNASEDAGDDENASEDAGYVENEVNASEDTGNDENAGGDENASEDAGVGENPKDENASEDQNATEDDKSVNEEEDNGEFGEGAGKESSKENVGNEESNDNEESVEETEKEANDHSGSTDETREVSGENMDETNEGSGDTDETSEGSDEADEGGKSKNQLQDQCDDESNNRWSDREWPASSVQSLVNCDLSDSKCVYFYPANFFDSKCGLGKNFSKYVEQIERKRLNGTLWNNMPAVGFPSLTMDRLCLDETGGRVELEDDKKNTKETDELSDIGLHKNDDGSKCMTERISFLHVHKSGGSSLHSAFNAISRSRSAQVHRHKFFSPSRLPIPPDEAEDRERQKARKSLEQATKYPTGQFNSEQHVIFALMRDPTERFISSMGQAMGANGSGLNGVGPKIRKACIDPESTPASTLKCVAKYVKDHTFWVELHFTPQVLDMSFATLYKDIPLAIFPFTQIKTVLDYFGKGDVKVRNGKSETYRTDKVLTDMTVDDYDDESLQIVCELYEMDVLMARSVGIEIPRCDPHIPHKYDFKK